MSKKIFIILFFLIISLPVRSEIIKDVIIEGNSRVSNETILIYGNIKKNEDASEIKINQITKDLYSTDFFSEVNIKFKNSILTINLKEYPVVNQLIIIGEKTKRLKEQIIKIIKTKENRSFIKSYFSNDIELIKTLYSSLGYNFTKVEASTKIIDENNLDLVIEIERGDKTKISKISFLGNNNISDKRLGEIVASEENKFWKFLTKNTNLSENIIKLDIRLLINY